MPPQQEVTPDLIKQAYKDDEINARQYHAAMWKLSRQTFENRVFQAGDPISRAKAVVNQVWDDWKQRYEEIQQTQKSAKIEADIKAEMKKTGKMPEAIYQTPEGLGERMWKDLTAAMAPVTRTSELSGMGWKNLARGVGAPEWMASLIGYAVEASASFVMTGKTLTKAQAGLGEDVSAAVKGVKALAATRTGAKAVTEAAPAAAEVAAAIPEEVKPLIELGAKELPKFDNPLQARLTNFAHESAQQARGILSETPRPGPRRAPHAATFARAGALPPATLEDVAKLKPGTVLNAEQIVNQQLPFKDGLSQLFDVAQKVVDGDPDAGPAFDAVTMQLLHPLKNVEAVKTESGRAIEILKATTPVHEQIKNVHDIYAAFGPEAAAAGNWDHARARLAQKLLDLDVDVPKVFEQAHQNLTGESGKTYGELFRQGYNAVLLAKPATWVKKSLGDIQGAFDKTIQYSLGGWMGEGDGLLKSDGPMAAKLMLQSIMHHAGQTIDPEVARVFRSAKTGAELQAAAKEAGIPSAYSRFLDYGGDPEKWNIPGKVFEGITSFAQNVGSTFGMYMNAHREGMGLGLTGSALHDFMAMRMETPSKQMLMEGLDAAGQITYTNPMGALGHAVQNVVQAGPAWMITPFFHVPANIVNRAFSNIPVVSLFTKGVVDGLNAGGVERDMQLGRLAWAQLSSQTMWLMAKGGMLTGNGPQNYKERQVWLAAGNRPYSLKLGNTQIPLAFTGALGIQAAIIADTAAISDYFDQPSLENMTGSLLVSGAHAVANEPFFESWGRLAAGLQDPEKGGLANLGKSLEQMVTTPASVLTGGPVMATAAREANPFSKSVDNVLDDIKQNIPMVRDGVPNRLNPLTGEKETLPQPWGVGWLRNSDSAWAKAARIVAGEINPMSSYDIPASRDPVILEMQRVGAQFPNFKVNYGARSDITGAAPEPGQAPPVNLTAEESQALIKQFATRKFDGEKTVRDFLLEQMQDPNYQSMPRQAKQQMFDQVLRGNNQQAFQEFKATHPEVAYRYATSGLQKILSATDPNDRQELEREYLQGQNEALQSENEQLRNESADKDMEIYNQTQPETTEGATPP